MPTAVDEVAGQPPLSREQFLDELDSLARVEHALCVEYLLIHAALGHDQEPADSDVARSVSDVAHAFSFLAQREMTLLHAANRGLRAAARPAQAGRASSLGQDPATAIPLVSPSPAADEHFLARAHTIAIAVDARYARLHSALMAPAPLFEGDVLEQLKLNLDPVPDHATPTAGLLTKLDGIAPAQYLLAAPRAPANDVERSMLALSDRYYGTVVVSVEAWFAHEDELGGVMRNRAVPVMDGLNEINGLLVGQGMLPAFTPLSMTAAAR